VLFVCVGILASSVIESGFIGHGLTLSQHHRLQAQAEDAQLNVVELDG
jgi:hypothetical protein